MTDLDERLAWLESRRQGVGASDVAGIVGVSPWASPWSVWADKVGLSPLDADDASASMRLGKDLEPVIARWFTTRTGLVVAGEQMMIHHREQTWCFATVDGLVCEHAESASVESALGVFEAKYTADAPWPTVPEHYRLQTQWAMYCSGLDMAWVACMHLPFGRPRFEVYEIARDETTIEELAVAVEAFWMEHVCSGIAPPADAHPATTAALGAAWIDPAKSPVVELDSLAGVVGEWTEMKAAAKQLEEDIRHDENLIKAALGDLTEGTIGGQLVVSWRQQPRTDIDRDRLRADHGDRYDRRSTQRVLRHHARKAS